jgi:dTDP-4-dehydrorhamnose 3,5-epimerase-like enzyme
MNVIKTAIPDVLIFEPKVFGDERGFFFERIRWSNVWNSFGWF